MPTDGPPPALLLTHSSRDERLTGAAYSTNTACGAVIKNYEFFLGVKHRSKIVYYDHEGNLQLELGQDGIPAGLKQDCEHRQTKSASFSNHSRNQGL